MSRRTARLWLKLFIKPKVMQPLNNKGEDSTEVANIACAHAGVSSLGPPQIVTLN